MKELIASQKKKVQHQVLVSKLWNQKHELNKKVLISSLGCLKTHRKRSAENKNQLLPKERRETEKETGHIMSVWLVWHFLTKTNNSPADFRISISNKFQDRFHCSNWWFPWDRTSKSIAPQNHPPMPAGGAYRTFQSYSLINTTLPSYEPEKTSLVLQNQTAGWGDGNL